MRQAAELWERRGRRDQEVWQGGALEEARHKADQVAALPSVVQGFLDAGASRERRAARRKRAIILLAVVAMALVTLAMIRQRNVAVTGRSDALRSQAELLLESAETALGKGEMLAARARLRGAWQLRDSLMARALFDRLRREPLLWSVPVSASQIPFLSWSPDGHLVAYPPVQLLDRRSGLPLRPNSAADPNDPAIGAAVSPDGRRLAVQHTSGVLKIRDFQTSELIEEVRQDIDAYHVSLAFGPDGEVLAIRPWAALEDNYARLLDLRSLEFLQLSGPSECIANISPSRNGNLVSVGRQDGTVAIWELPSGALVQELGTAAGPAEQSARSAVSGDGRNVIFGGFSGILRSWDRVTGEQLDVLDLYADKTPPVYRSMAFYYDERWIAAASGIGGLSLWDVSAGTVLATLSGGVDFLIELAFSPDGRYLSATNLDGEGIVWALDHAGMSHANSGHLGMVPKVAFGSEGNILASVGYDNNIGLWDVPTGEARAFWDAEHGLGAGAIHPDGTLLVTAGSDGSVKTWELPSGRPRHSLVHHRSPVSRADFSPDGVGIATGDKDDAVVLWEAATGQMRAVLGEGEPIHHGVFGLAYSRDGRQLAAGYDDGTILIWDLQTRDIRLRFQVPGQVWSLAWSFDDALIAAGRSDGPVHLWDTRTGEPREHEGWDGAAIASGGIVSFHPHEPIIAFIGAEGIELRDVWTGELKVRVPATDICGVGAAFSPDGRLLACGDSVGGIHTFHADTGLRHWRGTVLLPSSLMLLTHTGWIDLDGTENGRSTEDDSAASDTPKGGQWRDAVEKRASGVVATSPDGDLLCVPTLTGALEVWDRSGDELLSSHGMGLFEALRGVPDGCVSMEGGAVRLHHKTGETTVL